MEVLRTIAFYIQNREMPFMVIGGHAINVYGLSRQTGDIDLIVQREKKEEWSELLTKLGYSTNQDDDNFIRFSHDSLSAWPIDLMLVDRDTFQKMNNDSQIASIGVAEVPVVSPRHLVILKLHALKRYQEHRHARDYNDLLGLIRSEKAKISQAELSELCGQYATKDLYDTLKVDLKDFFQRER